MLTVSGIRNVETSTNIVEETVKKFGGIDVISSARFNFRCHFTC